MIKRLITPPFVVACLVLLVSAVSIKAVVNFNRYVLLKEQIAPRKEMRLLATRFGPMLDNGRLRFEREGKDERKLSADMEAELGTKRYLTRIYRDHSKPLDEPGSMFRLHLPYYTGTIDTVPHVPDRCWTAGGAQRIGRALLTMELDSDRIAVGEDGRVMATTSKRQRVTLPSDQIKATFGLFSDPRHPDHSYAVSYFFIANGSSVATPEGVRKMAFNIWDKYAYYCKVEVMPGLGQVDKDGEVKFVAAVDNLEKANAVTGEFLSYVLPEIMLCLPDWDEVKAGNYPASNEGADSTKKQASGVN